MEENKQANICMHCSLGTDGGHEAQCPSFPQPEQKQENGLRERLLRIILESQTYSMDINSDERFKIYNQATSEIIKAVVEILPKPSEKKIRIGSFRDEFYGYNKCLIEIRQKLTEGDK